VIKKASRNQKRITADKFRMLRKLGNGRKKAGEDLLDSWKETLKQVMRDYK
jgi:hypothetical protein